MAISSPALTLAIDAMFGKIKPRIDALKKLGGTDFSSEAPATDIKPGATTKVMIQAVDAASAFNDDSNNYLTGGTTEWATLTATHYLKGYDLRGTDIDSGAATPRVKQLFAERAGTSIALAIQGNVKTALDGTTLSTAVKIAASPTLTQYMALSGTVDTKVDSATSVLAVNGAEAALIKGAFAAAHIVGTETELAQFLGFADMVVIPGMTARMCVVPAGSFGSIGRVPTIIAKYQEAGAQTDPDTGLSVGIVVADDQALNRQIVNGDLWFGNAVISANATFTTPGIVKVGTAS